MHGHTRLYTESPQITILYNGEKLPLKTVISWLCVCTQLCPNYIWKTCDGMKIPHCCLFSCCIKKVIPIHVGHV